MLVTHEDLSEVVELKVGSEHYQGIWWLLKMTKENTLIVFDKVESKVLVYNKFGAFDDRLNVNEFINRLDKKYSIECKVYTKENLVRLKSLFELKDRLAAIKECKFEVVL